MRKYNVINTICTAAANVGADDCRDAVHHVSTFRTKSIFLHVITTNLPLIFDR